eukprot:TRINITY_DN5644_c0_g2_i1.p1 TRINITY_DN5644_c0_g2~~TRINITY_DN5644_c0_g2_i1.p1  ORF type:complete len:691 (+),score=84.97 TRINITY_DN5644_c0_g2_i1:84-2156(+)
MAQLLTQAADVSPGLSAIGDDQEAIVDATKDAFGRDRAAAALVEAGTLREMIALLVEKDKRIEQLEARLAATENGRSHTASSQTLLEEDLPAHERPLPTAPPPPRPPQRRAATDCSSAHSSRLSESRPCRRSLAESFAKNSSRSQDECARSVGWTDSASRGPHHSAAMAAPSPLRADPHAVPEGCCILESSPPLPLGGRPHGRATVDATQRRQSHVQQTPPRRSAALRRGTMPQQGLAGASPLPMRSPADSERSEAWSARKSIGSSVNMINTSCVMQRLSAEKLGPSEVDTATPGALSTSSKPCQSSLTSPGRAHLAPQGQRSISQTADAYATDSSPRAVVDCKQFFEGEGGSTASARSSEGRRSDTSETTTRPSILSPGAFVSQLTPQLCTTRVHVPSEAAPVVAEARGPAEQLQPTITRLCSAPVLSVSASTAQVLRPAISVERLRSVDSLRPRSHGPGVSVLTLPFTYEAHSLDADRAGAGAGVRAVSSSCRSTRAQGSGSVGVLHAADVRTGSRSPARSQSPTPLSNYRAHTARAAPCIRLVSAPDTSRNAWSARSMHGNAPLPQPPSPLRQPRQPWTLLDHAQRSRLAPAQSHLSCTASRGRPMVSTVTAFTGGPPAPRQTSADSLATMAAGAAASAALAASVATMRGAVYTAQPLQQQRVLTMASHRRPATAHARLASPMRMSL